MATLRPITRVILVLALVIVVVAVVLVIRALSPVPTVENPTVSTTPDGGGEPAAAATPRPLISVPRQANEGVNPFPSQPLVDAGAVPGAGSPHAWRVILIAQQNQKISEIDEVLFDRFGMSEAARAAVREINAAYTAKTEARALRPEGLGNKTVLEYERKLGLRRILGRESGRFENAEYWSLKRLREQHQRELLRKPRK